MLARAWAGALMRIWTTQLRDALRSFGQHGVEQVGIALAPLLVGAVIVAIVANVLQVGLVFNPARLKPNFEALNPIVRGQGQDLRRRRQAGPDGCSTSPSWSCCRASPIRPLHGRIRTDRHRPEIFLRRRFSCWSAQTIYSIALRLAIALLLIAIIEYIYRRWKLEEDLKMTKQEVKDEMRRMDGDPKMKQRRRQIALQRMQQKLKKDVPTADVVVTNPTHYAVALKYDSATMHAPKVVAKGRRFPGARIREIAIAHGVPILERKPLARALYQTVEVGQEIPEDFYSAIAEILAYVYELSGKVKRKRPDAAIVVRSRSGDGRPAYERGRPALDPAAARESGMRKLKRG